MDRYSKLPTNIHGLILEYIDFAEVVTILGGINHHLRNELRGILSKISVFNFSRETIQLFKRLDWIENLNTHQVFFGKAVFFEYPEKEEAEDSFSSSSDAVVALENFTELVLSQSREVTLELRQDQQVSHFMLMKLLELTITKSRPLKSFKSTRKLDSEAGTCIVSLHSRRGQIFLHTGTSNLDCKIFLRHESQQILSALSAKLHNRRLSKTDCLFEGGQFPVFFLFH